MYLKHSLTIGIYLKNVVFYANPLFFLSINALSFDFEFKAIWILQWNVYKHLVLHYGSQTYLSWCKVFKKTHGESMSEMNGSLISLDIEERNETI